ncbi:uncharacterized protein LOC105663896 isoform X3 [Megachile rotundata]|uniref:uncharacterized protein LOC105663896 isoform X3 n=1 Tax=Megachile rotundata TaxID=143995 RepID=UPI003FD5B262
MTIFRMITSTLALLLPPYLKRCFHETAFLYPYALILVAYTILTLYGAFLIQSSYKRFCAAMVCVVVILARRSSKYCTNVRGAGLVANSEGMLALVPKTNSCGENPVASCTEVLYEKMQNLTQSSQSVFVQYIFRLNRIGQIP